MEEAAAERARQARRGARRHDFRGARGQPGHLRRPKGVPGAQEGGARTSRKRVARIMRESGWAGTTRGCARRPKGGAKQAAPQPCAAPDLVKRDFSADGPDRLWFADITYVRTR